MNMVLVKNYMRIIDGRRETTVTRTPVVVRKLGRWLEVDGITFDPRTGKPCKANGYVGGVEYRLEKLVAPLQHGGHPGERDATDDQK